MSKWAKRSLALLALSGLACSTVMTALLGTPTPLPSPTPTASPSATFTPSPSPLPTITPTPSAFPTLTVAPTFTPPSITATPDSQATQRHLRIFQRLWDTVNTHYLYPDFNGHDWKAIGAKYRAMVQAGLTDDEFHRAMDDMIRELGDEHSSFESPLAAEDTDNAVAGANAYGGIGVLIAGFPDKGYVSIIVTFENSPAREAGLGPHDRILAVDGLSLLDANGELHSELMRGDPGTPLTLIVQSPDGSPPRDLTLTREEITGAVPIDYWLVPGTHIAYILVPTLLDDTIPQQVEDALDELSRDEPLTGVILDNRQNDGGTTTAGEGLLSLFTQGEVGRFRSRNDSRPLYIEPNDVAGSQTVPLVVLVGPDTVSYGEISSGILKDQGRATTVGETTLGNVEVLWPFDFEDGSRAWIAMERFDPAESHTNWEVTGLVPDVMAPAQWDEVSGADDPGVQAAVKVLGGTQ